MTFKELLAPLNGTTKVHCYLQVNADEVIEIGKAKFAEDYESKGTYCSYRDFDVVFMTIMRSEEGVELAVTLQ